MSREFEVTREIDLPAGPDDVWDRDHRRLSCLDVPNRHGDPRGHYAAGGRARQDLESTEPARGQEPNRPMAPSTRSTIRSRREMAAPPIFDTSTAGSSPTAGRTNTTRSALIPTSTSHPLGQYLEHFNGREVTYVGQPSSGIEGPESAGAADSMDTLRAALGISADAGVGDPVKASLGDAGELDGVIDYSTPEFLGVRTEDGLIRFFGRNHYGGVVGMSAHLFASQVDAAAREAALKSWLDGIYA